MKVKVKRLILLGAKQILVHVKLDDNPIDDACMEILCQSLAHNTSLKTIYLNDIEDYDITAIEGGWELFGKLIFDKTSLESIYH